MDDQLSDGKVGTAATTRIVRKEGCRAVLGSKRASREGESEQGLQQRQHKREWKVSVKITRACNAKMASVERIKERKIRR